MHLLCGPTGAGKTTYARELAEAESAVRFSIDEWMSALFWMDAGDPWEAFVGFVAAAVEAGAGSLRGLAGTFTPDDFLNRVAVDMAGLMQQVLERAQAEGAVRDDITTNDVGLFFEMLRAIRVGDAARSDALRRRYIEMLSPSFRAPANGELSVAPASWAEISGAWNP